MWYDTVEIGVMGFVGGLCCVPALAFLKGLSALQALGPFLAQDLKAGGFFK